MKSSQMNEHILGFKEWLGEDHWKALKYAVGKGKKAYDKKRTQQKKGKKPEEKIAEKPALAGENLHRWLSERKLIAQHPVLT